MDMRIFHPSVAAFDFPAVFYFMAVNLLFSRAICA
jgi:hypothetical protein